MGRDARYDGKFLADVGLFSLLLALVVLLYRLRAFDSLLRLVGQRVASKALGVPVTAEDVRVTVDGQLELLECVVHCAEEQRQQWEQPYLVSVRRIRVACDPLSLMGKMWRFSEICIDGIKLHVQKKDGVLNFAALAKDDGEADGAAEADATPVAVAKPASSSSSTTAATTSTTVTTVAAAKSKSQATLDANPAHPMQTTVTSMTATTRSTTTVAAGTTNTSTDTVQVVAFRQDEHILSTPEAKLAANVFTGLFGAIKTGAEQLQKEIQTSGGAEAWAANRWRSTVAGVQQQMESEGGLQSFVVNKLKTTTEIVSTQVQRYKEGVQRVQAQEVHHILRGEASRMPPYDGDPNEPKFLVDDFRINGIQVQLRDVLPPHLKALEAKPVVINLVHMTEIGHSASPRAGSRRNSHTEPNSAGLPDTPTSGRSTSRRAPPGKLGVPADYLRWLIERELISAALTQAAPEVISSGLAELGKSFKRIIQPASEQEQQQPLPQQLAAAEYALTTDTSNVVSI